MSDRAPPPRHLLRMSAMACTVAWVAYAPGAWAGDPAQEHLLFDHAVVDGRSASVYALKSTLDPEAAASRYALGWKQAHQKPVIRGQSSAWHIATLIESAQMQTVQFTGVPGGGSRGYRTVWTRGVSAERRLIDIDWLTRPLRVISRFDTFDPGRASTTAFASSDQSQSNTAALLAALLLRAGYSADPLLHSGRSIGPGHFGTGEPAGVLNVYRGPHDEISIAVDERDGGTAVLLQWMEQR